MLIQLGFVIFLSLSVLAVFYATHVTITRFSDYIINVQSRVCRFISDHASVICNISVSRPPVRCRKFPYRKLKSVDTYALKQDLAAFDCARHRNPPNGQSAEDIDELVQSYNLTLKDLTDRHVPSKIKILRAKPCAPWYNVEIDAVKRLRRKAERQIGA